MRRAVNRASKEALFISCGVAHELRRAPFSAIKALRNLSSAADFSLSNWRKYIFIMALERWRKWKPAWKVAVA
jgi:hypothetical protein